MRRSKSDPRKYTRKYRSISQRRMTAYDGIDEEQEMNRLKQILRESEAHLARGTDQATEETSKEKSSTRKRPQDHGGEDRLDAESAGDVVLEDAVVEGDDGEEALVVLPTRKKKPKTSKSIVLTPQEIRQAKLLQKNTARKLKTLELRAEQKKRTKILYQQLQETAITQESRQLLQSSATLGKKVTKKERLQKALQKERAGMDLTAQERDLLYKDRGVVPEEEDQTKESMMTTVRTNDDTTVATETNDSKEPTSSIAKRKAKKQKAMGTATHSGETASTVKEGVATDASSENPNEDTKPAPSTKESPTPLSFAAQMMASLSTLKTESTAQSEITAKEREAAERKRLEQEENKYRPKERYIPTNTAILKSAATLGLTPATETETTNQRRVQEISRPDDVKAARFDLPVAGMEFEVMDAIRNNDVTIICSETGSGKSTQIPQFLYEAGMTIDTTQSHMIGVTQPRRVAAVSTAKRVCYEMGQGNGQTIQSAPKGRGNLVAYQTRYEKAGLGSDTHVKFMTDGILLQEIQSDLLLRKYSAIILDEAHERNLNTDVLIGLLSVALPLRKEAAREPNSDVVPLKLVIMSATLRVEDFAGNDKLFPSIKSAVVKVPGRMHPVTIHHSKTTELDDYEEVAFQKIRKIHRKLPQGGILVFLTGKQEVIRMVNRLRRVLNPSTKRRKPTESSDNSFTVPSDVSPLPNDVDALDSGAEIPRDMDDEELDGDLFRSDAPDDYEEMERDDGTSDVETSNTLDDDGNVIPSRGHVLPLYSLLSVEEQAKVFVPAPDGHRLIVVATNIAETSITIPGISYVVDTGRQKCRNYNAATGVASYDIMWISKAAADQRAGRAGRTGPGHAYRLYSSSMYARHMDDFSLPEVLTRPLEDVVLAMKAMKISKVANFPFPTPPERKQITSAIKLLANIGCVDLSKADENEDDGEVTRLGAAVAKLPLGVRYGKILLVAAQAGVLDYAIAMVAALSEASPFIVGGQTIIEQKDDDVNDDASSDKETMQTDLPSTSSKPCRFAHKGGDVLAAMSAVGAYTYAGRGAGGASERVACRKFCEENGLNFAIMGRIQKMRVHLARLAMTRLSNAEGIAAKTGGILSSMAPPNKLQERLLVQAIASGLLDNVAMLAPVGLIPGERPFSLRSVYLSCSLSTKEPLLMNRNSVVYSRDSRLLPQWVCFDTLVRKTLKDGTSVATMRNITPIDPSWLGSLAKGSRLLSVGEPLPTPLPSYDADLDAVMCCVSTKFGLHGWEIPPIKVELFDALQTPDAKRCSQFMIDDSFRWFARFLFEGKVIPELADLEDMLSDSPAIITRRTPVSKVALLVSALSDAGVDSVAALRKHWAENDSKFLFKHLRSWIKPDRVVDAKKLWINTVKQNVNTWKSRSTGAQMAVELDGGPCLSPRQ